MESKSRVLIVMSNPVESKKLQTKVRNNPYVEVDSYCVPSAEGGLIALETRDFDLILLDPALPDAGGTFSIEKLKSSKKNLPLVLINTPSDKALIREALDLGVSAVLTRSETKGEAIGRTLYTLTRALAPSESKNKEGSPGKKHLRLNAIKNHTEEILSKIKNPSELIHENIKRIRDALKGHDEVREKIIDIVFETLQASLNMKESVDGFEKYSADIKQQLIHTGYREKRQHEYKVLLVDDEPEVCEIIKESLEVLGVKNIDVATDGREAYNLCTKTVRDDEKLYDFIISDWLMPDQDGEKLLELIRKNYYYQDTPFMMISAVDERHKIAELLSLGLDQYLIKPFTSEDFNLKVKRLISFC